MTLLEGVSKTAILTLRARADEHDRADRFFADPVAKDWLGRVEWPVELDLWYTPRVQHFLAARADEIDRLARRHLDTYSNGVVLELGVGLSTRSLRLADEFHAARFVDLDLVDIITLRNSLTPFPARIRQLVASVTDTTWHEALAGVERPELLILAEGLVYYLPKVVVDTLFLHLRQHFAGSTVAFDILGDMDFKETSARASAVKLSLTWKHEAPFERAWQDFGLDPLPDWPPAVLMADAIDRYWGRLGPETQKIVSALSKMPSLAGGRSGLVAGTLKPT